MQDKYITINEQNTAYRIIDGEAVIVNLKKSTFHTLNPVATFIWDHLDGKAKLEDIAESLSQEFEVDYETSLDDCEDFIRDLLDKDMIILSSQPLEKS
jgi:hypothetical protein